MKLFKKAIPMLAATALLAVPATVDAKGYQFNRTSITDKWQGVNGFITIPKWYAASPTTETYPELFYGFYNSNGGFDIGIGTGWFGGGGWKIIFYGTPSVKSTNGGWSESSHTIPNVNPGDELQLQAAIIPSGGQYFAQLDVYKNGTWLDALQVPINYSYGSAWMTGGGKINRELNMASNSYASTYTKSGAYFYNAKGGRAWLIKNINDSNSWYAWTPARTAIAPVMKVDGEPGVYPNPNYYSTSSTTDANGYAIDDVTINFPSN